MKKKMLSFVLILTMLFTLLPQTAFGVESTNFIESEGLRTTGLAQPDILEVSLENVSEAFSDNMDGVGDSIDATQAAEYSMYASDYYYNQLSDAQQQFWDSLDGMCLSYLTGTSSFSKYGSYYITGYVSYSGMDKDTAINTALMFKYSSPQYYFLDLGLFYAQSSTTSGSLCLSVISAFANGGTRATATTSMFTKVGEALAVVNTGNTEVEKEKLAHDWIVNKVSYDTSNVNTYNQVAYSVFNTSTTVCAGYSQAMQLLLNGTGVDCTVQTSLEHEWNIVRLNDAWYFTDLTWNDQDGSGGYSTIYNYFNRSYQYMLNNDQNSYHVTESLWSDSIPTSSFDSGATYTSIGSIYTPSSSWTTPSYTISSGNISINGDAGAKIYYTTDGTTPSEASTKSKKYTGSFSSSSNTILAVAVGDGKWDSGIMNLASGGNGYSTVSFDTQGANAVASQVVSQGSLATMPSNPTRSGYTFAGWYTSTQYLSQFSFSTPINGNIRLYAKWIGNSYKVKLNANGGYIKKKSTLTQNITVTNGETYASLVTPKRAGYVFVGWYTKKTGGTKIKSSTTVNITGRKTYYARWVASGKTKQAKIKSITSTSPGTITVKAYTIGTTTGYQICYSTKKSFKSAKKINTTNTTKTITGLTSGKTYYVQVRMYQKDSVTGKRYYGSYSATKKIVVQ